MHHTQSQVQAQLVAAEAAARAAMGPRGGQPPRALQKAVRDAKEALVRNEEVCKLLNSFNLEKAVLLPQG